MSVMYKPDTIPAHVQPMGITARTVDAEMSLNKDTATDEQIERAGAPLPPIGPGQIQVSLLIAMPSSLPPSVLELVQEGRTSQFLSGTH